MRYISPILLISMFISACGDGGGDITAPSTGSIEITATTTGETSATEYTVSIDGQASDAIGLNASLIREGLSAGTHAVLLGGLPEGCTVTAANPRVVTVTAGETAVSDFAVTCVPPVGTIRVAAGSVGPAPAPYELMLDGVNQGPIGSTAIRTLEAVPVGSHSVGLSAIPANCELQGQNPQSTTVAFGETANVAFALICTQPPAETGSLSIGLTTTGATVDPDGYTIAVDGGTPQLVATSGSTLLTNVTVGVHSVLLSGIAANCTVSGANPQDATVTAGASASVSFVVACSSMTPTTGSMVLRSITSGAFPDPDGYTITVNGSSHSRLQAQDTSVIDGLEPVSYLVEILGIAANCRLDGQSLRTVPVTSASTTVVDFAIDCSSPPPIAFVNSPNVRGIITLVNADGSGLTRLSHEQTRLHRPVWSPDGSKIAFDADGLYIMNPDGTGLTRLTTDLWVWEGSFGRSSWAPDGSMIAVTVADCPNLEICGTHIWLARTDGSGATQLAQGWWPSWSPDGRTILFFNGEGAFTVGPDGSGLTRLNAPVGANYGVWSPDGARIALMVGASNAAEVFVMNRDGSGLVKLTQEGWDEYEPVWSPDGRRIAIQTRPRNAPYDVWEIDIVMADGSGRRRLTGDPLMDHSPAWSPDGSQIAFVKLNSLDEEVYVISAEGGVPVNVSNNPLVSDVYPSWSSR
jgi:Tol biopolymer transport system component